MGTDGGPFEPFAAVDAAVKDCSASAASAVSARRVCSAAGPLPPFSSAEALVYRRSATRRRPSATTAPKEAHSGRGVGARKYRPAAAYDCCCCW